METHFDARNENDRRGNIRKHGKAGSHIVRLIADESLHEFHAQVGCPEYKVVDIQSQNIQEIRKNEFPVFFEILQHRPVTVAVFDEIPTDQRIFQCRRHKEPDGQRKQHTAGGLPLHNEMQNQSKNKRNQHSKEEIL